MPWYSHTLPKLIGQWSGSSTETLVLAFGQMHGNEPAGTAAIQRTLSLLHHLSRQPNIAPLKGAVVGLRGNAAAAALGKRCIHRDLNRLWKVGTIDKLLHRPDSAVDEDERELLHNVLCLQRAIAQYNPQRLVMLDLHTMSSEGAVFLLTAPQSEAELLTRHIPAPVVAGLGNYIEGTALHYFNAANLSLPTIGLGFEAGNHQSPQSPHFAVAVLLSVLRAVGCLPQGLPLSAEEKLLHTASKLLPAKTRVVYRHAVKPFDRFVMRPGFSNFQPITTGEHLADDQNGTVLAPHSGYLLLPLYQAEGNDGFFIVEEVA